MSNEGGLWQETPPAAVVTAVPAAPEPVVETTAAPAAAAPAAPAQETLPRDFAAELAARDAALEEARRKMESIQGASQEAQDEKQRMVVEMARLVNEKTAIERAKNEALTAQKAELEEVSQATQTLASKTATLEQQLTEAQSEATTLRVLSQEFPNLLKYSQFIPKSTDAEEVRRYCRTFSEVRENDLGEYRQVIAGNHSVRSVPTGTPAVRVDPLPDGSLEDRLNAAMNSRNPQLFEEELRSAIRQFGGNA